MDEDAPEEKEANIEDDAAKEIDGRSFEFVCSKSVTCILFKRRTFIT